jgi:hypothetical protein
MLLAAGLRFAAEKLYTLPALRASVSVQRATCVASAPKTTEAGTNVQLASVTRAAALQSQLRGVR